MSMIIILSIVTYALLILLIVAWRYGRVGHSFSFSQVLLEGLAIQAAIQAISMEILSLLRAITPAGIGGVWGATTLICLGVGIKTGALKLGWNLVRGILKSFIVQNWKYLIILLIPLGLTFITGFSSAPNTNDGLLYHLPRVAHWYQDGSLAHYATAYNQQLAYPIFPEISILTLWLTTGSDQYSFVIQWMALIFSLIGVRLIVRQLGGNGVTQWLAVFFIASLPSVILQASSTQTDLVTAFWYVLLLYFLLLALNHDWDLLETIVFSCSLALGLLTKATFYLYAFLPMIFLFWIMLKRIQWRRTLLNFMIIASICLVINAGYWSRNLKLFGTPFGSTGNIDENINLTLTGSTIQNPIRVMAMNLVTPYETINHDLFGWLFSPEAGSYSSLPQYWLVFSWNDEDYAGNPLHLLLIFASVLILFLQKSKRKRMIIQYLLIVIAGFLTLSFLLVYNAFILRYFVPFFIACAPIFALGCSAFVQNKRWLQYVPIIFVLIALPWLLINKTRPIISLRDHSEPLALKANWIVGNTGGSILLEPRTNSFFARSTGLRVPYLQMADAIRTSGCRDIGIRIDSSDPEYDYWWILGAPFSEYHLESIYTSKETANLIDPNFLPCGVICTICDDADTWRGLGFIGQFGNARLFLDQ